MKSPQLIIKTIDVLEIPNSQFIIVGFSQYVNIKFGISQFQKEKTMYERYLALLEKKGVKTADVAKATGIHPSTFSDWKKGKSTPKAEKLQKIADYFGVPIDYFLSGKNFDQQKEYYVNEEAARIAQRIFETKGLRTLFDAAEDASPKDLELAAQLLRRLKETNPDA